MKNQKIARQYAQKQVPIIWSQNQVDRRINCIHGQKKQQMGMTRKKKIQCQLNQKKQNLQIIRKSSVVVMISQIFLNYLRKGFTHLSQYNLIVFDQCHHCRQQHPYNSIMKQFYIDQIKISQQAKKKRNLKQTQQKPFILGLTASPISYQCLQKKDLKKQLQFLCHCLRSKFIYYSNENKNNRRQISINQAVQKNSNRQNVDQLIKYFQKYRTHSDSYQKLQVYAPQKYFQLIQKIMDIFTKNYPQQLGIKKNIQKANQSMQLVLFYDIKQCLLIKLRDIWLQLGQFAFYIAFQQFMEQLQLINLTKKKNKDILQQIIQICTQYKFQFKKLYGKCQKQYFSAKVNQLIKILQQSKQIQNKNNQQQQKKYQKNKKKNYKYQQYIVVFAATRRTVKYLQKIIKFYKQTKPLQQQRTYDCQKVTGYSIRKLKNYNLSQNIISIDPSQTNIFSKIQKRQKLYLQDLQKLNNDQDDFISGNKQIDQQYQKIKKSKLCKLLLQVFQKYSTQIKTIQNFRSKKFKILITTSVTQQGFDIPQCNKVISFNIPTTLKSYIQIQGRARKQNSKYYIFTNTITTKQMLKLKQDYDNMIKDSYYFALNCFSQKNQQFQLKKISINQKGYQRISVKDSGALINTNSSLQILLMYCTSLPKPNKLRYYYLCTPGICFRCIIYFPKTAPIAKQYIIGQNVQNKKQALKSAAYQAVKYLYKQKYLTPSLRPRRFQQIQQQRQMQKFNDLQQISRNEKYRQIFQQDARVDITKNKYIHFYYKSLDINQLDFAHTNKIFKKKQRLFIKQQTKLSFQVYKMKFSNNRKMHQLIQNQKCQQIGLLTCFQKSHAKQMFQNYHYIFQQNNKQRFSFQLVVQQLQLSISQYNQLKKINEFILSSCFNTQISFYQKINNLKIQKNKIGKTKTKKQQQIIQDQDDEIQNKFFPIITIIKKTTQQYYQIDNQFIQKIKQYINVISQLLKFHNNYDKKIKQKSQCPVNLKNQIQQLIKKLQQKNSQMILQNIQKTNFFSKCVLSSKIQYSYGIQNKEKNLDLRKKNQILCKKFKHVNQQLKQVLKIKYWNKVKKQLQKQFFLRQGKLMQTAIQNNNYYLIGQFIVFPIDRSLLFKANLAVSYIFKGYFQYVLAYSFRQNILKNNIILKLKNQKKQKQSKSIPQYTIVPNIIFKKSQQIFKYLSGIASSTYLNKIGESYQIGTDFDKSYNQIAKILKKKQNQNSLINQSISFNNSFNNSINNSINSDFKSLLNSSNFQQCSQHSFLQISLVNQQYDYQKLQKQIDKIKISQILKSLTTRKYKSNNLQNYQLLQFIGDIVLKTLSTIQTFINFPQFDQSQLHIRRASIICNSNLHKKSILKRFYKYILNDKRYKLLPKYKYKDIYKQQVKQQFYQKTNIKRYNQNTQQQGFLYIPGKVHADVIQALIGAIYLNTLKLQNCQLFLYSMDILQHNSLKIKIKVQQSQNQINNQNIPKIYKQFQQRIKYKFNYKHLLIQSFTHSSFKQILQKVVDKNKYTKFIQQSEIKQKQINISNNLSLFSQDLNKLNKKSKSEIKPQNTFYQRLQFLGDALIDLIVVQYLYQKQLTNQQGKMSSLKQIGVNNNTLGMIAISIGMHKLILMDSKENDEVMKDFLKIQKNYEAYLNQPKKLVKQKMQCVKLLGDVFQALAGAIYVDNDFNYPKTKLVLKGIIYPLLDSFISKQRPQLQIFNKYLSQNNYRQKLFKDPNQQMKNGMFKFLLTNKSGQQIDFIWQKNEKLAWEGFRQKHLNKQKQ